MFTLTNHPANHCTIDVEKKEWRRDVCISMAGWLWVMVNISTNKKIYPNKPMHTISVWICNIIQKCKSFLFLFVGMCEHTRQYPIYAKSFFAYVSVCECTTTLCLCVRECHCVCHQPENPVIQQNGYNICIELLLLPILRNKTLLLTHMHAYIV